MNILYFQCSGFCLSDLVPLTFVRELLELVLKPNLLKEASRKRIIYKSAQIRNENKGKQP